MCAVYISVWCLATLREPDLQRHVAEAMSSQQVPGSGPRRSPADADGTYKPDIQFSWQDNTGICRCNNNRFHTVCFLSPTHNTNGGGAYNVEIIQSNIMV